LLLAGAAATGAAAGEQTRGALLDVPYLAQPARLCGGAALAMVMRYWGESRVFADDFSALVEEDRGGIPAGTLARAVTARGWHAVDLALDEESGLLRVRDEVDRRRPVIALIEAGTAQYHFVVIVGVTDEFVVLHDPARAPFQVVPHAQFDAAWSRAERWMLVILPPGPGASPGPGGAQTASPDVATASTEVAAETATPPPCGALVSHSVGLARSRQLVEAERGLTAATSLCPSEAAGWRELAGLRFLERRYAESRRLADLAASIAPEDAHAWQLLATSRYLTGDFVGALEAWNRVGEPRTDVLSIEGVRRTPHAVILEQVSLPPRALLTARSFVRAARRLDEVPVAGETALRYEPTTDGWAGIEASIDERRTLPDNWMQWGAEGVETLLQREVTVNVPGHLGAGENVRARYRWAANRPRVLMDFAAPAPNPLPGIVTAELWWERQAYASVEPGASPIREERIRTGGHVADWATDWLRWQAGVAIDRFDGARHVALGGQIVTRLVDDHVAVALNLERWTATAGRPAFATGGLAGAWRWSKAPAAPNWRAFGGAALASDAAPLALWPAASTTLTRRALLRAHPVRDGGVINGEVFGRRITFVTIEHERPVWSGDFGQASVVVFMDAARAWQRREPGASPWHTDLGAGVRFGEPGSAGVVRLDVAIGLRDRQTAISAGYVPPWGR
jgi:hypothetical protein